MARSLFEPVPDTQTGSIWTPWRAQTARPPSAALKTMPYDTAGLADRAAHLDARGRQSLLAAAFGTEFDPD